RVEHPVAHLLIDKQGRTNIPQPTAPKQQSSSINVFDLAVGHALLNNGEIYYNDRESSLDADVYDLRTDVTFDYLATRYRGWHSLLQRYRSAVSAKCSRRRSSAQ